MISTKGRYALRVMIDLAQSENDRFVPLKEIAQRQEISKKYLEIIVRDLVKANLIQGTIGKNGGYKLLRKPEEYSAGEIIEASEGPFLAVSCLADEAQTCPRAKYCKTLPLWVEYNKLTRTFFYEKKLSDLL